MKYSSSCAPIVGFYTHIVSLLNWSMVGFRFLQCVFYQPQVFDILFLWKHVFRTTNGKEIFFDIFNSFSVQYKANKSRANNKSLCTRISAWAIYSYAHNNIITCRFKFSLEIHLFKTKWRQKLKLYFLWFLKAFAI